MEAAGGRTDGRDGWTVRLSTLPPPPPLPSVLLPPAAAAAAAAADEVGREIDLSHLDDLLTSDISNRSIYFANIFRLLVAAVVPFSSLIRGLSLLVEMSVFIHV